MDNDKVIAVNSLSTRKISQKKSLYDFATVPINKKEDYEDDGWEVVPSKLTKSIRMTKLKDHNVAFEDRVWALCARMGFEYINSDNQFRLEYGEGLSKQIDVIAFDAETILIFECKSTAKRRRVSYQKDINELAGILSKLRFSARKITGGKQKVTLVFCTNNAIISQNDKTRLRENSIQHFNQDVIEYYEQLTEHLGRAAKYQLFGQLFSGQTIPELKNRIPAIRGKVSAGHTIYSFCVDPEYLLKIGYILHRTDINTDATYAYQRLVKKNRLNKIAKYIDNSGYFPNSIIINIETKSEKDLRFDIASKADHDGSTHIGILYLPKSYKSAFIIDGQHRLYGYSKSKSESSHTIPVVAFHNLPVEEQSRLFVDINRTQKSVPANLLQSIMADFQWGSANEKHALSAVKTRMIAELNADDDSPFYKRVILSEEKKTDKRCLTINTLKSWGLNRVKYFGQFRGDRLVQRGILQDSDHHRTLEKAKRFINETFKYVETGLQNQWDLGSAEGGFIAMNIGVSSIIRVLDDILDFVVTNEFIDPFALDGDQLAEKILDYLDPIIDFVKSLDYDGIKKLRSFFGSGATEKVQRYFQHAIHKEFPNFKPEGLDQWVAESSGEFNSKAHDLGHNKIEPMIDKFVKEKLRKEYGEKDDNWWISGVPKKIQKICSDRKIDDGSTEPAWNYLNTIHYEQIIGANWPLLGDYFTPPGQEKVSKKRKLAWLSEFNKIRQKYTHPQRENIAEKELEKLESLHKWLSKKLS